MNLWYPVGSETYIMQLKMTLWSQVERSSSWPRSTSPVEASGLPQKQLTGVIRGGFHQTFPELGILTANENFKSCSLDCVLMLAFSTTVMDGENMFPSLLLSFPSILCIFSWMLLEPLTLTVVYYRLLINSHRRMIPPSPRALPASHRRNAPSHPSPTARPPPPRRRRPRLTVGSC